MRILKVILYGAIGIKKGLGLEEIEIDFTEFKPGLIAITGPNGNGKTTIMENLHPYRRLVSREGAIENHFFSKYSKRELWFEVDGNIYKSILSIDGVTGASEAYLYIKDDNAKDGWRGLTDKYKGPYDEAIEGLLGSEDLFFNSVFSAQKSKGIAQLKPGERRKLFYELLNLTSYETLCERSKEELKQSQLELGKVESEIATLESQNAEFSQHEANLEELNEKRTVLLSIISDTETAIKSFQEEIRTSEIELAQLQVKEKQNEVYQQDINKKEIELDDLKKKVQADSDQIFENKNKAIANFLTNNDFIFLIRKREDEKAGLEKEESEAIKKVIEESRLANNELTKISSDLSSNQKLLSRAEQLSEKKDKYAAKLEEKKTAENALAKHQQKKSEKQNELLELQRGEAQYKETISSLQNKLSRLDADIKELNSQLNIIKTDDNNLRISFQKDTTRVKEEMQILVAVPCGEIGKGCQFLSRAYELKDKLPDIESNFNFKTIELSNKIAEIEQSIIKKESERDGVSKSILDAKEELKKDYTDEIECIQKEIASIDSYIKSVKGILDDLNQYDWEKLNKEAQEAETQKLVLNEKTSSLNERSAQLKSSMEQSEARLHEISRQYKDRKDAITKDIESLREQEKKEENKIIEKYDLQKLEFEKRFNQDSNRINAEIGDLMTKIDHTITDKISEIEKNTYFKKQSVSSHEQSLMERKEQLPEIDNQIAALKADLDLKATNEKKIEAKKETLKTWQQEVKEYAFLVKAFDKTGIPVLKLENSGVEITTIANELLSIFDNKFRIVFETTRLKADGKSSKETFDINVVEDDGVCEISNKSGGQQVILETAIRLAISIVVRQQGRNIQTSFLDEADGALDLDNALHYIQMIRKTHEMTGVYNTFIITHRPELLDFIPQQIRLKDGIVEVVN